MKEIHLLRHGYRDSYNENDLNDLPNVFVVDPQEPSAIYEAARKLLPGKVAVLLLRRSYSSNSLPIPLSSLAKSLHRGFQVRRKFPPQT